MDIFGAIVDFIANTNVPDQFREVDVRGLFTNPWFLVPFIAFIGYHFYKQSVNTLVITALVLGLWIFSGSPMMEDLVVDGHLQLSKVLPVAGVGVLALGIAVYFLFIRSD
ncbi:hypothetical protein [Desulfurivibrio sp. C05AmB]|jgi:hypothetical protein|uniref:hypothetical protein n=1 Tax=Desulfurivibrio sp. C05AmB TaxID=3374371 RepID=UPI00376EE968